MNPPKETRPSRIPTLHLVADISGSMCELGQQSALCTSVQSILRISDALSLFEEVRLWTSGTCAAQVSAAAWDGTLHCRGCSNLESLQNVCRAAQSGDCLLLLSDGSFNSEQVSGLHGQLMERGLRLAALAIGPTSSRSQLERIVGKGNVFAAEDTLSALYSLAAASDFLMSNPDCSKTPTYEKQTETDEDEW